MPCREVIRSYQIGDGDLKVCCWSTTVSIRDEHKILTKVANCELLICVCLMIVVFRELLGAVLANASIFSAWHLHDQTL